MNIKYFRVFVSVYEHRSMSLAGEEHYLSQPAVSRIIREMERYYSCRFFLRHSGKLYRTESGEKMYLHAKQLLSVADQMYDDMREQTRRRKVRVGATPTAGNYYIFDAISRYQAECGALDVCLSTMPPENLEGMVKSAELDFAIVEGINSTKEITVQPLFEDRLTFVAAEGAQFSDPIPLLVLDRGSYERVQFEQRLLKAGIVYEIKGEFADVEGVRRCAQKGMGIGLLPIRAMDGTDGLRRVELPGMDMVTEFSVALHRQKYVFPELAELLKKLKEYVDETIESRGAAER